MLSTKGLLSNKYSYEMSESYFPQESYFERSSWQIAPRSSDPIEFIRGRAAARPAVAPRPAEVASTPLHTLRRIGRWRPPEHRTCHSSGFPPIAAGW